MKKPVISLIVLLIVSALCVTLIAISVNAKCNDVTITKEVLYGDKSLADGYTVTTRYQYNNQLFWETEYNMNGEYSTDYSYYNSKQFSEGKVRYQGIAMDNTVHLEFDTEIPAEEQEGIAREYKLLYDSIDMNQSVGKALNLKDYYDYYPVNIHFDMPGVWWSGYNYEMLPYGGENSEKAVIERFKEFFKIPVAENDVLEISVHKENMDAVSMGVSGSLYSMSLNTGNSSAVTDTHCYFAVNNTFSAGYKVPEEYYIDVSQIEDGYGIYSVEYKKGTSTEDTGIIASSLKTAFPLDSKETVIYIGTDSEEKVLNVITSTDTKTHIYFIDLKNMELIQKHSFEGKTSYVLVRHFSGYTVAVLGEYIAVFSNKYELEFKIEKWSDYITKGDMEISNIGGDNSFRLGAEIYENTALRYEDGKLLVADSLTSEYGYENCGFYFAIYTKDGLQYYSKYSSSIGTTLWIDNHDYNCYPTDTENIVIKKNG